MTRILSSLCLMLIVAGANAQTASSNFELILVDVPGMSEIENGRIDEGIDVSTKLRQISSVKSETRVNLCAAYILKRDFESAEKACNDAVSSNRSDAAYNNRGVLRALQGKFEGATSDFRQAHHSNKGWGLSNQTEVLSSNLRALERFTAMVQSQQGQQATARN
jgi:Flp pilus assembly protein TadD